MGNISKFERGFCFVDLEKHDENLTFHLDPPNLSCLQKTCKRMQGEPEKFFPCWGNKIFKRGNQPAKDTRTLKNVNTENPLYTM